mmetsp:Transcript_98345/g.228038  ORF Transcript_98345/g.228038 Transcript_98345/m.228038 type:complete len:254 (-) Transcript_98345:167-928(-)|eukprot:CAMPEP_0171108656 /NCGR_PEP_ID=MMETSP0766_2-20121228/69364_1 /TAXON_ID=439317 /ORGANISM="Gambierdiscus australes, Strain CAWD 149" /LENGTH=253 /DNA_ID=CAMNT_0011570233 /DNA_START=50 /DNA_END=811 /DNA_ORIENTATION=+
MESWKRILLYAGGAAGVAAVLYYLLREEPEVKVGASTNESEESKEKKKMTVEDVTKEQVQEILNSIVVSQEKMRGHMKALTKQLRENRQMTFEQAYARVREVQPEDPLERHGLSMFDFDQLLNKFQSDSQVRQGIVRIMGVPPDTAPTSGDKGPQVPASKTVEVHAFMLQELEKLLQYFHTIKDKESYDVKTVTLAAQAVVGAKVEEKYNLSSEDIERAVVTHHSALAMDQEFASINMKMQQTMAQLMGAQDA